MDFPTGPIGYGDPDSIKRLSAYTGRMRGAQKSAVTRWSRRIARENPPESFTYRAPENPEPHYGRVIPGWHMAAESPEDVRTQLAKLGVEAE